MKTSRLLSSALAGAVAAACVAALVTLYAPAVDVLPRARAQNVASGQKMASGSTSISAGTPAVIVTGTAGAKIVVTAMRIATVTTGGLVTFYDGAATTTALFSVYAPASTSVNNNVEVSPFFLGNAWPTIAGGAGTAGTGYGTAGNSLCAQLNGCTLVYEICYYLN